MTAVAGGIPHGDPADIDAAVPWHYGDPFLEQRLLLAGSATVDLSHRGVIAISGPDRLTWLDSLTSQYLLDLRPGDSTTNLLLDPNGRVESELHCVDDGERLLISVEPGNAAAVVAFLDRMRFLLRVEVTDATDDFAVVWQPVSERHPEHPTWLVPSLFASGQLPDVGADVSRYRAPVAAHFAGRELFVPRAALPGLLAAGPRAGSWAWNALRIAAGVPRFGVETDDRTIPHEVGWIGSAVHMRKGCYRGQETVARTFNMGKPPRRLTLLHFDGTADALPGHGTPVLADGRQVGWIGMSVQHHELGPIASAILKRNTDPRLELDVAQMRASQEIIINP